jgi:ABC-type methionine transport system ATPase subunit
MGEPRKIQIHYPLERLSEPVIARLVTEFELLPNILRADVDAHQGGWMVVELGGDEERVEQALTWMRGLGLGVAEVS